MADSFIQMPPDSTGKLLDTSSLTVGGNTVQRERMVIADPTTATSLASVKAGNTAVAAGDPALAVSLSPNSPLPSGTNVLGHVVVDSFGAAVDVTDRAGRLVGVVYGSQGQQLKQTATNFNLQVELATGGTLYDARQIRALTASDVVTVGNATIAVTQSTSPWVTQDKADVAGGGTTAPAQVLMVGGKTNDGTPQYDIMPLGAGGRTVIIEGFAGGTAVPVSGTVSVTNFANPLPVSESGNWTVRIVGNGGATLDSTIGAATAPTNALAVSGVFQTTIPVLTAGQAVAIQVDVSGSQYVDLEGRKATYSAVANSTTTATFTAASGDIAVLPGSATKTIRVTRVEVTLSTTGTAAIETVSLIKRSAADTGGTSSAMTIVPHDANFSGASAAPLIYTATPTPGAAVGFIRVTQFNDQSASLPGAATWIWTFGDGRGGAGSIVLRGTAQELCINLAGVVATQTAAVSFEWTEE